MSRRVGSAHHPKLLSSKRMRGGQSPPYRNVMNKYLFRTMSRPDLQGGGSIGDDVGRDDPLPSALGKDREMPRTDSRKANQRRRFQKQRTENRKRLLELKSSAPKEEKS
jgi:hypothetical protein